MDPVVRETCGKYVLLERLGRGAVGETYAARAGHSPNAPLVCIKILGREHRSPRRSARDKRRRAIESLQLEARVVASLDHPNIARMLDSGPFGDDEGWYIAFELIEGANLWELAGQTDDGKLSAGMVRHIGIQVAKALQCAHAADVLHRDIKPENLLVSKQGAVKLVDFGLAKVDASLASNFSHVGTPRYYAPEQVSGEALTPQSDLYSLGVVLLELLVGVHPYSVFGDDGDNFPPAVLRGEARFDVSSLDGPPDLLATLEQCLELHAADRPLSAADLVLALQTEQQAPLS